MITRELLARAHDALVDTASAPAVLRELIDAIEVRGVPAADAQVFTVSAASLPSLMYVSSAGTLWLSRANVDDVRKFVRTAGPVTGFVGAYQGLEVRLIQAVLGYAQDVVAEASKSFVSDTGGAV